MIKARTLNRQRPVQIVDPLERATKPPDHNALSGPGSQPAQHNNQQLQLSLFGGLALHVKDRRIDLPNRKAKTLIAYLALIPGMRATREHLVGLFWSETESYKARASLRQLLHILRDFFNREAIAGFSADKFEVSLDALAVATDVGHALESVVGGYPLERLVNETLITETILTGYDNLDPSFGEWLRVQRESIRQQLIRSLETHLLNSPCMEDCTRRLALALVQVDPTHEMACRKLMSAYVDAGDVAGALAVYKKLWDHLEKDYDMEPSTATQELVAAIKSGTYQPQVRGFRTRNPGHDANNTDEFDADRLLAMTLDCLPWPFTHSQFVRGPSAIYIPISYDQKNRFS